jgi:endonuclease YncB( thermonuclease family)
MARWLWHWDWRNVDGRKEGGGPLCEPRNRNEAIPRSMGCSRRERAQHHAVFAMSGPWQRPPHDTRRNVVQFRRRRASRLLVAIAAGLAFAALLALARLAQRLGQAQPGPLPQIVRGAGDSAISPSAVEVIDGDTIRARGRTIRLVGFDTAEAGLLARCSRERELADRASTKLKALIAGGGLELRLVPGACPPGTEGTQRCNYGRSCGVLTAHGRDVGATMIQEGLARSYVCGATSCPPRGSWC